MKLNNFIKLTSYLSVLVISIQPVAIFAQCQNSAYPIIIENDYPGQIARTHSSTSGSVVFDSNYPPPRSIDGNTQNQVILIIPQNTTDCGDATISYQTPGTIGNIPGCQFYMKITGMHPSDYTATATPLESDSNCYVTTSTYSSNLPQPVFHIGKK